MFRGYEAGIEIETEHLEPRRWPWLDLRGEEDRRIMTVQAAAAGSERQHTPRGWSTAGHFSMVTTN